MIYLLKIGWQTFALENDKGLATVVRTLSRAQQVEDHRYGSAETIQSVGPCEVSFECLPGYTFTKKKPKAPRSEPIDIPDAVRRANRKRPRALLPDLSLPVGSVSDRALPVGHVSDVASTQTTTRKGQPK